MLRGRPKRIICRLFQIPWATISPAQESVRLGDAVRYGQGASHRLSLVWCGYPHTQSTNSRKCFLHIRIVPLPIAAVWFWWLAILCCSVPAQEPWNHPSRPKAMVPDEPQFFANRSEVASRLFYVFRKGNMRDRNSEMILLEIVDKGCRLRKLHQFVLQNRYMPGGWNVSMDGRFVVTTFDIEKEHPDPKNDLVVYDLVRDERTNMRIQDFLPQETVSRLRTHDLGHPYLFQGYDNFDMQGLRYFPNTPEFCRRERVPFVVVDLLERSAGVEEVPDSLPDSVVKGVPFAELECDCPTDNQIEPDWDLPLAQPRVISVTILPTARPMVRSYFPFPKQGNYALDSITGDYLFRK